MSKIVFVFSLVASASFAQEAYVPEDPAVRCAKQPEQKIALLEHEFHAKKCPALEYLKRSLGPKEAYFAWCKQTIEGMNQLFSQKVGMDPKVFERKRSFFAAQKSHINSLVNEIAGDVEKICQVDAPLAD